MGAPRPYTVGRRETAGRGEGKGIYKKSKPSGDPKFIRIGSGKRLEAAFRAFDRDHERRDDPSAP